MFKKYANDEGEFEAFLLNESAFQCLDFAEQLKTDKKVLILFDEHFIVNSCLFHRLGVLKFQKYDVYEGSIKKV